MEETHREKMQTSTLRLSAEFKPIDELKTEKLDSSEKDGCSTRDEVYESFAQEVNRAVSPLESLGANDIEVRAALLVSNEINQYNGRFDEDGLQAVAEKVIDAPILVGHRKDKLPIGGVSRATVTTVDNNHWVKVWFYWLKSASGSEALAANIDGGDTLMLGGNPYYYYSRKVSDVDGVGTAGVYSGVISARNSMLDLNTVTRIDFQVVSWELDDLGDSVGLSVLHAKAARDTLDAGFASLVPVTVGGGAVDSNRTEQGGSGDSTSIARWVWNTPASNHTGSGTFGGFLDTDVSGLSSGAGAFSVTLIAVDTALNQVVSGTSIGVFNLTQTALLAVGATSSLGEASFNLNAGSYIVTATDNRMLFPAYDTIEVTGSQLDTISGYSFDPGAPQSPTLVRAYGVITNIAGEPDSGAVISVQAPGGVAQTGQTIVSPFAITTTTDSTGFFYLDLIPSSQLIPDTLQYLFTIYRNDGAILRKSFSAPDSVSWRLKW